MGLFDFFKKKKQVEPIVTQPEPLATKEAPKVESEPIIEEVVETMEAPTTPVETPMVEKTEAPTPQVFVETPTAKDEAPIVNLHTAANENPTAATTHTDADEDVEPEEYEGIKVETAEPGSHYDNLGGMLGFNFMESNEAKPFIDHLIGAGLNEPQLLEVDGNAVHQIKFNDTGKIYLRSISRDGVDGKKMVNTVFPYLATEFTLPFETFKVSEWETEDRTEAEISGIGRNSFGFTFYATDYLQNKAIYQNQANINVKVSAIAMVVDKSNVEQVNGQPITDDFAAYLPTEQTTRATYFDFIGNIIKMEECILNNQNIGYIIKVKLINHPADQDFFTVDIFVNKFNMRIENIAIGQRITGAIWLQGEIAK